MFRQWVNGFLVFLVLFSLAAILEVCLLGLAFPFFPIKHHLLPFILAGFPVSVALILVSLMYIAWFGNFVNVLDGSLSKLADALFDALIIDAAAKQRICKVCREFLAEASVLIFVFPVLDQIIDAQKPVTKGIVIWSGTLTAVFLFFALILTIVIEAD